MLRNFRISMLTTAVLGCLTSQVVAQEQPANEPQMLGPTSVNAGGKDFVDAKGRRWISMGKVQFKPTNIADLDMRRTDERKPAPENLTLDQLAEALRPRRLVGDVEYRLGKPDYELAAKIMKAGKAPIPTTNNNIPPQVLNPRFIIGSDDRTRIWIPQRLAGKRVWLSRPNLYLDNDRSKHGLIRRTLLLQ